MNTFDDVAERERFAGMLATLESGKIEVGDKAATNARILDLKRKIAELDAIAERPA